MSPLSRTAAVAVLVLVAGAASAQKMAPGLWEMTIRNAQLDAAAAQMREQMAKMPADQRKMVEEMMAKQGVAVGGKPNTVRMCITPEQAARGEPPQDPKANCRHETVSRSASSMRFKFSCTDPQSSGSGEVTYAGDKSYAMKMNAETTAQGRTERMEMQQSGRWIGADCGALRPAR